ncbi:hypothetical protein LOK49_LG05G02938 [Camellia lanceoleosa]|uniref:Uncharacterized protein n=1 Tax=Camellia lanceoleosa TaxID=1840588 RepID=A0ACC0HPC2_9ERIC|nr:hypothetical protein LOK49_LG05G02938 [Camellia lanceoleosa]
MSLSHPEQLWRASTSTIELVTTLSEREWVAEWNVEGATKEDYQKFANAQLDVYGKVSFGWAYWTLKNVNNHWSLEWMINNHYIKL